MEAASLLTRGRVAHVAQLTNASRSASNALVQPMIVPATSESTWEPILSRVPAWRPSRCDVLVLSPHPDDETLGAGGLIARQVANGCKVTVVAVTDGEGAYPDYPALAQIRRREQEAALERLGVPAIQIVRLRLPDRHVGLHEEDLVERLLPLVSKGTCLVAPWSGDYHPDHEACGRAAERVATLTGASLASYLFWTWHRGTPECLKSLALLRLPLTDTLLVSKSEALLCHRSQLERPGGEPILPDDLLSPARRPYEVYIVP